ncbi:MAG TPA: hypothetical protein VFQ77_07860 [Pseudonocardiaceae bacterium]|nr:hypothetical protein [Pseudonocardiaceae bacterium]
MAVYLHVHVTHLWLVHAAAPDDLIRRGIFLARCLAQDRDEVTVLAVAGFSVADVLLIGGAFTSGRTVLNSLTLPLPTAETAGLVGLVTAGHAVAAAAELTGRFGVAGEVDSLGFVHTPTDAGTNVPDVAGLGGRGPGPGGERRSGRAA